MAAHEIDHCGRLLLTEWSSASPDVSFERSGATAIKTVSGWDNGLVLSVGSISAGKARWAFYVGRGQKISIGACAASVEVSGYVNKTTAGWGYYQANGNKGHAGPAKDPYGLKYKAGDVVAVEIDATAGTLEFFLNDASQGIAFRSLPRGKALKAAVSLYNKGDQVTLLGREGTAGPRSACFTRAATQARGTADGLRWTKYKDGWTDGLVLIGGGVREGVAKWTFKVNRGKKLTFGVCVADVPLGGYLNQSAKGWGWYQGNGKLGCGGPANVDKGWPRFVAGDTVEVRLDTDLGELRFARNGRPLGVAFDNLPTSGVTFVGGFSMYEESCEVEVLHIPRSTASSDDSTASGIAGAVLAGSRSGTASGGSGSSNRAFSPRSLSPSAAMSPPMLPSALPTPAGLRGSSSASTGIGAGTGTGSGIGAGTTATEVPVYSRLGSGLTVLADDRRTLKKTTKNWDDGLALGGAVKWECAGGIARWWFRVNQGSKITIGIVLDSAPETFLNKTSKGWGLYQSNGNIGHGGPAKQAYSPPLSVGDTVCVEMLLQNAPSGEPGSLRFIVHSTRARESGGEGEDRGVAFRQMHLVNHGDGVRGLSTLRFCGAASLYNVGDSITLLRHEVLASPSSASAAASFVAATSSSSAAAAAVVALQQQQQQLVLPSAELHAPEDGDAMLRALFASCGPMFASGRYKAALASGGFDSVDALLALHARSGNRAEQELVEIGVKWGHARELLQALLLFASQRGLVPRESDSSSSSSSSSSLAVAMSSSSATAIPAAVLTRRALPRIAFAALSPPSHAALALDAATQLVDFAQQWQQYRKRRALAEADRFLRCSLGDLNVLRKIGRGDSGQLFEVEVVPRASSADTKEAMTTCKPSPFAEKMMGRKFALKKMWDFGSPSLTQHMATAFQRDFNLPREHPHQFIMRIHAMFAGRTVEREPLEWEVGSGRTVFVLMDLCQTDLRTIISRDPRRGAGTGSSAGTGAGPGLGAGASSSIGERQVLLYALQLSLAIAHLWRKGIAHRDVTLGNVLLFREGELRLVGFGCASATLEAATWEGETANMPPECLPAAVRAKRRKAEAAGGERARNAFVDCSGADVWALGCVSR